MQPLAERLRPKTLDEYIGQKHLVGPGAILRKMIDAGRIFFVYSLGTSRSGKNDTGTDYRQQTGNSVLYFKCSDFRRERCPRSDRPCQEQPIFLPIQPDSVYR